MSTNPTSVGQWLSARYYESGAGLGTVSAEQFQNSFFDLPVIKNLQQSLNYQFTNRSLLFQALTHSSFIKSVPEQWQLLNNERLEFLGDAILGSIVSETLYQKCPEAKEGQCSLLRGSLVNEESLCLLAAFYNLGNTLLLSKGEVLCGGQEKKSLLADAFEAVIAAVFVDSDYETAKNVCLTWIGEYEAHFETDLFSLERLEKFDPKTKLQEKTMALYKSLPRYESATQEDGEFEISLFIDGEFLGSETSISKKRAQKKLAQQSLDTKSYVIKKESSDAFYPTPSE